MLYLIVIPEFASVSRPVLGGKHFWLQRRRTSFGRSFHDGFKMRGQNSFQGNPATAARLANLPASKVNPSAPACPFKSCRHSFEILKFRNKPFSGSAECVRRAFYRGIPNGLAQKSARYRAAICA